MAKRLTDTAKWQRPWFRDLAIHNKLLWLYILDNCDMAGVWYVDLRLASFLIGAAFVEQEAVSALDKQITILGDGNRWLVNDFISFQYGEFKSKSPVHRGVTKVLAGHGLKWPTDTLSIGYRKHSGRDKDKDKALDKAKAKVKAKDLVAGGSNGA